MKCGYTCTVTGLIANDMQIAVEAVSVGCCALLAAPLRSHIWPWPSDAGSLCWQLLVCREVALPGPPALRVWAMLAAEMSLLTVKAHPSYGSFLLGV